MISRPRIINKKKNEEEQRRRIMYDNGSRAPLRQPSPTPVWDKYVQSTRVNIMPDINKAPKRSSVIKPKMQPKPKTPTWDRYVKSTRVNVMPDWKKAPKQNMLKRPQTPKTLTPTWDRYVKSTRVNVMPDWKRVEKVAPSIVRPKTKTYNVKGGTLLNRPKVAYPKPVIGSPPVYKRKIDGSKLTPEMKNVMKTYELNKLPVRGNIVVDSYTGTRLYKPTQKTQDILNAYS